MGFFNSIKNVDELLNKVGYLRKYLRVYDEKDIILFRYNSKGDAKMLSNMYPSSVPLPWRGKKYNSVEQMIISAYIEDNCNPKYKEEMDYVLDYIYRCDDGMDVKSSKDVQALYKKVRAETIEAIGEEKWDLNDWVISSKAIEIKYEYCPEFREFVNAHSDKYFCEYIYTKPKVKAGVLKVTDENSPFYGKYIGANYTGIAIQRCLTL